MVICGLINGRLYQVISEGQYGGQVIKTAIMITVLTKLISPQVQKDVELQYYLLTTYTSVRGFEATNHPGFEVTTHPGFEVTTQTYKKRKEKKKE